MIRGRRSWMVGWLIAAAFAAACVYQGSHFKPAQLDAANSLRPLLAGWFKTLVDRFGLYRTSFIWDAVCLLALTIPAASAFLNYWRRNAGPPARFSWVSQFVCSKGFFLGSIFVSMSLIRAPWLLIGEINVDESQFLVSAEKLFKDPVFFRAVDTGTAGPLDVYPLMLPVVFGIAPDYVSGRIIALVMLFVSVWILYRALGLLAEDRLARLASVPIAGVLGVIGTQDLEHYASEVPTLLLLAGAVYATLRIISKPRPHPAWFGLLGLLACAAFFAKMQSVPLLAAVLAVAFLYLFTSAKLSACWQPLGWFFAGATAPFALNAAVSGFTGVWGDFWTNYIKGNLAYAHQAGGPDIWSHFDAFVLQVAEARYALFTLTALTAAYLYQKTALWRARPGFAARATGLALASGITLLALTVLQTPLYLILGILVLFAVVELRDLKGARRTGLAQICLGLLALALLCAGAASVYVSHRAYEHYLLLLLIPAGLGTGGLLLRQQELLEPADRADCAKESVAKHAGLAFLSVFLVVNLAMEACALPTPIEYTYPFRFAKPTIRPARGDYIRSITPQGTDIVVWGWDPSLYLAAGVLPATRDTNMRNFFSQREDLSAYHRRRFLADINRNHAEVFIDAATASNNLLGAEYRVESVPEVAAYVASRYVLAGTDSEGVRYYRAAGLPPVPPPPALAGRALRQRSK